MGDETGATGIGRAGTKLIVEGWRFVPHSYAIVNQWQLLALVRRQIALKVIDAPYYRPWRALAGLFDSAADQALRSLETARSGETADVTLRIFAPFSFAPSASRLTAVFATLEQQLIRRHQIADAGEYERIRRDPPPAQVRVITPSRWSAEGFYKAGFTKEQVTIVPHGVDADTFHPMPEIRHKVRERLGIGESTIVFLSVGAMTGNKGIDLLLRGFAAISREFPEALLLLKGIDPLYGSRNFVDRFLKLISARDQQEIADKVIYIGEALSHRDMASLYQAADVYVSPYRAEAFNLPVLEAAACGIPIICTRGGPTDEFVTDAFAWRINSRATIVPVEGQHASQLEPKMDHLIALMAAAIDAADWRRQAAAAGPRHVGGNYTWDRAVDTLLGGLFS